MRTFQFSRFKEFRIEKPIPIDCDLGGGKKIPEAEIPPRIWKLLQTTGGSVADGDASGQDFNVIRSLKEQGYKPADIYETFLDSPRGKDAERRKPGHVEDYLRRTLNAGTAPRIVDVDFSTNSGSSVCLASVEPKPLKWLWPNYIVLNRTNLLAGDSGKGKSVILVDIAARLSRGRPMPEEKSGHGCNTLFLSSEDTNSDILVPRLEAADADRNCIHAMNHMIEENGEERPITFPRDIKLLAAEVKDKGAQFIIVDPIGSFVDKGIDLNCESDIRKIYHHFDWLASKANCTVLLVAHLRKSLEGTFKSRVAGSGAMVNTPRMVLAVRDLPDNTCVFGVLKTNISEMGKCLQYKIKKIDVSNNGSGKIEAVGVRWMGPITFDMASEDGSSHKAPAQSSFSAKGFLRLILNDCELDSQTIFDQAIQIGLNESVIKSAAKFLHIKRSKQNGVEVWKLPKSD